MGVSSASVRVIHLVRQWLGGFAEFAVVASGFGGANTTGPKQIRLRQLVYLPRPSS